MKAYRCVFLCKGYRKEVTVVAHHANAALDKAAHGLDGEDMIAAEAWDETGLVLVKVGSRDAGAPTTKPPA